MSNNHRVERVYVAVDVQNIWYSCRKQFGPYARVDFKKLRDLIFEKKLARIPRQIRLTAYTITAPAIARKGGIQYIKIRNGGFLNLLGYLGFEVRNRRMQVEKGFSKPFHTDWDVGIAIDALKYIDSYDTFTLVSGDGDYSILIENLQEKGKFVEVITVQCTASNILHATANRVIHLTENELLERHSRGERKSKEGTSKTQKQKTYPCQDQKKDSPHRGDRNR